MQDHPNNYEEHEARLMTRHLKVGCILVAALMPFGAILDWFWFKYSYTEADMLMEFFGVRVASSLAALLVLGFLVGTRVQRFHTLIGLAIAYIPVLSICWMIYITSGAESPYYAGLNLVLLAIAFVLQWGTGVSLAGVVLVLVTYLAACWFHGTLDRAYYGIFFNNVYFLALTGLIVVVGSAVHARLRKREFETQKQLDQNLLQIEQSRAQLAGQNEELEQALNQLNATEVQLQQSEKLALMGELSAGIIHEINNPLNTARQGIYALKQKASAMNGQGGADCEGIVTLVEEGVQRVIGIVGNMRQLAHPEQGAKEAVVVSEVVDTALRLLISEWKQGRIRIEQSIPAGLSVWANRNGIVHVFINLLKNAFDALKTVHDEDRVPTLQIEARTVGRRVVICVRDNGPGIALSHQPRVFDILGMGNDGGANGEPSGEGKVFRHFFTTKAEGAGMGMGLGICRRIVRSQNGKIAFRSEPGVMCEFSLDLPAPNAMEEVV